MAKVGGARQGAGRPVGSLRRRHQDAMAKALGEGQTPIEYMLAIMRDETADPKDRQWAAEKASPFVHPRPAPIERTVEIELPDTSSIAGVDAALDRIIAAMGKGEISPAEGQSMVSVLETRRKSIETGDLLARIEKLEAAQR